MANSTTNKTKILMTLMGMEIGGAETHVLELSKTLQRMGLDVHVVSNGGVYVRELEECGIKHYRVPLHNKQFINVFSSYRAIRRIIIDNNIRLVHAHARIPAFICGLLRKRLRFQLVTTAHLDFSVAFPFKVLTNWGDRVLAVSSDIKDYLLAHYKIDEKNISLTVNGVDTNKFSPDIDASGLVEELGLSPDTMKIVSVSRLDSDRSQAAHMLIEIAEELAATASVEFILVGDGNDFDTIAAKAEAVNANRPGQKLIHMTGQRMDVNRFMALADVFVNVSRSALEAMSAGTPVILAGTGNQGYLGIFDESTLATAMETNFTCRNCPPTTKEKLLEGIKKLLELPEEERTRLGRYAREVILSHYSMERMALDAKAIYEEMLSNPPPLTRKQAKQEARRNNVVISGYYGYHNSGDDNLLLSIVQNLREYRDDLSLTVLSLNPKKTRAQFGVNAIHRFNFISVFLTLRRTGLLITGGGNLIQDETSTKSLIYYLWVINTARRLGAKNMLYGKGIGPVNHPRNIIKVRRSLNRVNLITLRERESLEMLSEIGITGPEVHLTADAAFALPPAAGCDEYLARIGVKGPFFAVSLRSWANNPPDLEVQVAAFADYIVETYGYQVVFVPLRADQDVDISRKVMSLMKQSAVLADPAPQDFDRARAIMGAASFALAMRLHALIYAMEKGVPCIGLVYSPKIRQFMEYMQQRWHMPVEETQSGTLIQHAQAIHADKERISADIYESVSRLRELAAQNAKLCVELIGDK